MSQDSKNVIMRQRENVPHFSSLIALRFFAAAGVVFSHTPGPLPLHSKYVATEDFASLMAFFHILSGFTLAYVYPKFESRMNVLRFWVARIGRIWPVHVAMIFAIIVFFWSQQAFDRLWWRQFLANTALVQTWLPSLRTTGDFNGAAWSLSTEFALYLLFPLLIIKWSRTWHIKLFGSFCLAILICWYCSHCQYHPGSFLSQLGIVPIFMVYVHPFTRLFEFTLGMALALLWGKTHEGAGVGFFRGTLVELVAVAFCLGSLIFAHSITSALDIHHEFGVIWKFWIERMLLPALAFSVLIFVFSLNIGKISMYLGTASFVFLGELSFCIYMVHIPLRKIFTSGIHDESNWMSRWAIVGAFWLGTALLAYAVHFLWEQPARKYFRGLLPAPKATDPALVKPPKPDVIGDCKTTQLPVFRWTPAVALAAALALAGLVFHDGRSHSQSQLVQPAQAPDPGQKQPR